MSLACWTVSLLGTNPLVPSPVNTHRMWQLNALVYKLYMFFVLSIRCPFLSDINECTEENGGCNQTCTNSIGSYQCSCRSGYLLSQDGRGCDSKYIYNLHSLNFISCLCFSDVNECSIQNGYCEHLCTDFTGGHVCSCFNGFLLSNGHNCTGELFFL